MASRLVKEPGPVFDPTTFGIVGAENQSMDPGQRHRSGAHGAGLEGNIELTTFESRATE